jgi:type II secretory pathway pseudopilin PulG
MRGCSSNVRSGERGFSIIEIGVVLMIAGILTSMSLVMFSSGKARYQLSQKARGISWQIERARSLAVKYNQTLTVGFLQDGSFGLTCTNCDVVKSELQPLTLTSDFTLSSHPTLTIKGNGTITGGSSITLSDATGRQVSVAIANSGKTSVGDVS